MKTLAAVIKDHVHWPLNGGDRDIAPRRGLQGVASALLAASVCGSAFAMERSGASLGSQRAERTPAFQCPQDLATPAITLTFADPRPTGCECITELAIFGDGTVVASKTPYSRQQVKAKLPPDEWRRIQHVLFAENEVLNCCSDDLARKICALRQQRQRPEPGPESAMTILQVRGEGVSHEIRCHAVGLTATQLPDLLEIQRLHACERCLLNVMHVVQAGGYEKVEQTLATVNRQLERERPGRVPLAPDELSLVDERPDGTRYLQFCRLPSLPSGDDPTIADLRSDEEFLIVSVFERPGVPLEISIIGDSSTP